MSLRKEALKNRVIAKQKMLESRLAELKANTQDKTADEIDRVKAKLKEAEDILRNGWEGASKRISEWLDR